MLVEQPQISVLGVGSSFTHIERLISVCPVLMKTSLLQIFCKNELMQDTRSKKREFLKMCGSCLLVIARVWSALKCGNHMVSFTNALKILL